MKQSTTKIQTAGSAISAALAILLALALALGIAPAVAADSTGKAAARRLTEEQKIIHLLNRIGYGPRPGDVERVKQMGVESFLDQQLNPQRIDDSAVEARLAPLESLRMEIAEIYEKYPPPAQVARQLGLRMPNQAAQQQNPQSGPGASATDQMAGRQDEQSVAEERQMRQKIVAYYMERGLKPPQRLLDELQAHKIIRAVYSERQLQEVMTDFWFNHFNIFWGKGADRWLTTDFEMNAIRPNALGKFEDLLMATAKSPAMLFYLDNFQSMSPDAELPARRGMGRRGLFQRRQVSPAQQRARAANQLRNRKRGINENYAREIMELHTLGVDGGYTQKDVQEVARALTGWTIDQPRRSGKFVFREWMHDDGEKVVLGQKIPAGGGIKDGEKVINILAHHPNTAKFISTKLARRFVSDNPPPSVVEKASRAYTKTGGDIREVLKAIFTSPEFYAPENYRAKIKSPFELAVSAIRALGGNTNGAQQLPQFIAKMGQPLYRYQAPTGYPDRAEQWVNTGALLERLNFALALSANRVRGTQVDIRRVAASSADAGAVMDQAIELLLNGDVSPQTRAILDKQLREGVSVKGELAGNRAASMQDQDEEAMASIDSMPAERANRRGRRNLRGPGREGAPQQAVAPADPEVAKVFGLVLGSPEFQRR